MADVAAHVGVSHQTVSRVLNGSPLVRDSTRRQVLAAIEELGYRRNTAARALVTNRSGRIGLVAAHLGLFGPSTLSDAVREAGYEAGYEVALVGLSEFSASSLHAAVDRLLDQAVEAIVVAVAHRDARERTLALDLPVPVVMAEGVASGDHMAAGVDQTLGAVLATDHLLDQGHQRIVHVAGPLDWIEAIQREAGWRVAQERRGRSNSGTRLVGDWSARSGYDIGVQIADDPSITAVFAANDAMALGVLKALHEKGRRVPEDISVVGFDDVPEAAFYWPALTTVKQDFAAVGRNAVELAVRAVEGESEPVLDLVAPSLIVRDSTAMAPRRKRR